MKRMTSVIVASLLLVIIGISGPNAPKAEDDFQLVKVAEGVYAAIAKRGGLASGNAHRSRQRDQLADYQEPAISSGD